METDEQSKLANYEGFSLVSGGLIYKLMTLIFRTKDPVKSRHQRAFFFGLIAWLPISIMILLSGEN